MKIAIRMDDITPEMDWPSFERFRALADRYGVKPLIGVVPDCRDAKLSVCPPREDFWELILKLQEQGWIVAMHGCHHLYSTAAGGLFPLNGYSEFAGVPEKTQDELISLGREIFASHGIETDFFMAPAHTFDRSTLKVLKAHGFYRMTDGFGRRPYVYDGITFYPISFDRAHCLKQKEGATTFVVHVNGMDDAGFAGYEEIFRTQQMLPYSEYIYLPAARKGPAGHLLTAAMAAGKRTAAAVRRSAKDRMERQHG
ncbi:MAG: DUF2334 domain-containing protein [Lachnospiraceae bacterium]|jgi:hypothetical protein|nr:DUF2334 domain-containing protein [Lachnospiraceae bacterium]